SRRRHTRFSRDWSSDVCSSDLYHFFLYCTTIEESRRLYANRQKDQESTAEKWLDPGRARLEDGLEQGFHFTARARHELPFHRNRSEEHTSELQSRENLVCRLLL